MARTKAGDRVRIHHAGTLDDRTILDASVDRGLEFTLGAGQVIPGV